ncbi:MAG: sulfatase-like hydrolase/transferase [Deltaproteobacteria bacterium]|nr:sulfatase-like hydrolase/transferase [Deltaproteobacteria bacterium]
MRTAELAVDWLERWSRGGRRKPFFLWVHLFDPHLPYEAPEIDRRGAATPYDAEVTTADRATGRIVDWLRRQRLIDETFVALTSDHGESLGEHEERTHSVFVYEATMHVPFIVRYPPLLPRGRVHRPTVRGVDLAPTLLRALGLPGTRDSQGADLLAALAGRERGPELDAYSESLVSEIGFGMAPLHAIRRGPWTYVRAPRPELYDRSRDPRELENLYDAQRARAAELDRALETVLADSARRSHRVDARALDRTTSDQLQALGYLADPGTRTSMSGMDPKDGIRIYARIEQARGLARREQYDAAIEILLGVLGDTPNNVTALNALALCYLRENEPGEAESVYRRSFALDASQHHVLVSIARIRRRARDFADARALLDRALAIVPSSVDVLAERGITERDAGDADAAQRWLRRAVEADPQSSRAQHLYGQSLLEHGDARGARDWLTRALARSPRNYDALMQAGVASERLDDLATAASFYRRAGEVRRDAWRPPLDLARLRARAGDLEGAIRELERATQIGCSDVALVNGDEWLAPVRSDPRFAAMLERIRANAEAWRRRREER